MSLKIICYFTLFFIEATYSAKQVLKERVKREGEKGDELLTDMVEMENYAIYKPVNELLLEVAKMQERWIKIEEMMRKTTKKLIHEDEDGEDDLRFFNKLWNKWTNGQQMDHQSRSDCYIGGHYFHSCPTSNNNNIRLEKCDLYIFNKTVQNEIEQFYKYAILNIAKPIDDLSNHQNQTLKDLTPLLKSMKNIITLRLKSCDVKDQENCKENVKSWTLEGTTKYKSKIAAIKPNLNEIMSMLETVSDDIRKFKYQYQKALNEKKKEYLCCVQSMTLWHETACFNLLDKYDFAPIELGTANSVQNLIQETTTQNSQPTTKTNN